MKGKTLRQLLIITILITSALFFFTCKKESNPIYLTESAQLSLQVDGEPYCTEVYLQLKAGGIKFPGKVQLVRDSVMIFSHQFDKTGTLLDTLLLDSALLPGTSYHYEARLLLPEGDEVRSRELSLRTIDTTSHNFTWEIIEFGGGSGSSDLYDVAIIDENNIWAVGEIHTPETDRWNEDSTEWISPYNAVHWDGEKWELLHVPFSKMNGGVLYPSIQSIFYTDDGVLWMTDGGTVVTYKDGKYENDIRMNPLIEGSLLKIWGTSSSNIYIVGRGGTIVHYNGSRWEKIESGTDLPINDIWGIYENSNSSIYAVASSSVITTGNTLFKLEDGNIMKINFNQTDYIFGSLWFKNNQKMLLCGDRIYEKNQNNELVSIHDELGYYKERIRGSDYNNIFVCGHFGIIEHFNGANWRTFTIPNVAIFNSLDSKDNLTVAVGIINPDAVLVKISTKG
ncbi:MAG: hypothetical protein Kow00108_20730 [Calditrichia bacterium]